MRRDVQGIDANLLVFLSLCFGLQEIPVRVELGVVRHELDGRRIGKLCYRLLTRDTPLAGRLIGLPRAIFSVPLTPRMACRMRILRSMYVA